MEQLYGQRVGFPFVFFLATVGFLHKFSLTVGVSGAITERSKAGTSPHDDFGK